MTPPTVLQALTLSAGAVRTSLWLVPVGFAIAVLGQMAAALPAPFLSGLTWRGQQAGAQGADGLGGALDGALAALLAPRTLAIAAGLWLAGLLLKGALRVLWVAGALPTLGEALAGRHRPAFAAGAVWGYPRLLATAFLGLLLQGLAAGGALGVLAALLLGGGALLRGARGPAGVLASALALTGALALPLLTGLLADAALARAGLRGEGPGLAFAGAALRLGRRPAAFAALALAAGLAALLLSGSLDLLGGAATQVIALRTRPELVAIPRLAWGALAALLAALLDLWWLGAVAALACHAAPGDPPAAGQLGA